VVIMTKGHPFWQTISPFRVAKATVWSVSGLISAFKSEASFRLEVLMAAVMVPFALYLGRSGVEKALLISSVLFVLIVELINTAVETLVERISPEWHTLSGRAKDIGSASVLVTTILMFTVWALILWG